MPGKIRGIIASAHGENCTVRSEAIPSYRISHPKRGVGTGFNATGTRNRSHPVPSVGGRIQAFEARSGTRYPTRRKGVNARGVPMRKSYRRIIEIDRQILN